MARFYVGKHGRGAGAKRSCTQPCNAKPTQRHVVGKAWPLGVGRWWPGDHNPGSKVKQGMNTATMKDFVDLAHEMGWEYPIWLWARWNHMNKQMEQARPLFRKGGVVGIKVDFMDRDDQEMVNFYSRLTKLAAENHLMVDLHGAYKPTGLERTYPNLLTREGVWAMSTISGPTG